MGDFSNDGSFFGAGNEAPAGWNGSQAQMGGQMSFTLQPGQTIRFSDGYGGWNTYGGSSSTSALMLESFTRATRLIEIQPPNTVIPRRVLPGEDTDAFIEWGDKSRFASQADQPTDPILGGGGGGGGGRKPRKKRDNGDEDGPEVFVYTELARKTQDVRVTNPDDSDQYVMVQRILQIWFRGEKDGDIRRFDLKPPGT